MKVDFKQCRALVDQGMKDLQIKDEPSNLYDPIRYILDLGGKRFRPVLTLLSCGLFDENVQKALDPALGVEVFHNFTLMHDDIMDDAPLRRGKPTVHMHWDESVAILSGDVMLVKAYELISSVNNNQIKPILKAFNLCAVEVCEGQQKDIDFEKVENVSKRDYLEMIHLKTAVLLGFAMELGARIGGANDDQIALVREFGENLGIGFQLKDDILDIYGDHAKFGKQVGGDIKENKKTFLWIEALKMANDDQNRLLIQLSSTKELDSDNKVHAVKEIYDDLNIKAHSEERMNAYFDKAFEALDILKTSEERKLPLRDFIQALINREK